MDKRGARSKYRSRRAPQPLSKPPLHHVSLLRNLRPFDQLLLKSRGSPVVCGRVIGGRVLELYQELSDSPATTLEACILSAIFALRYLSRDLAANVEPIDVGSSRAFSSNSTDGPSSQYWNFGDGHKRSFDPSQKSPSSPM